MADVELRPAVRRAGLPRIAPHGERHTVAALLAAADVHPAKLSNRMGHIASTMTIKRCPPGSPVMAWHAAGSPAEILAADSETGARAA